MSLLTLRAMIVLLAMGHAATLSCAAGDRLSFNARIRPILSDKCYRCHGPDAAQRKAGLRLDTQEGMLADLGGYAAVQPGDPGASALVKRIRSDDPDFQMPPPESTLSLDESEKEMLAAWIGQGAQWENPWSFIPPTKPAIPHLASALHQERARNPIDHFILAKLDELGLPPSPQEEKQRLLRRVAIDLTGLPPSIAEIDAFLADAAPDAYERVVDRLLQSPAHAERLALDWMDLARYADSHGMHADGWRMMWPWRDWVIRAFQANSPYDHFVTWQLAGDLLPSPTREQVLATAFHRNHPMTAEGGVVDEEFRLNYVFDRAQTTATAFLGLTMECARCHDHKFDPIRQTEYYQLSSFFNNVNELGMTGDDGNYGPMLLLPSPQEEAALEALDQEIVQASSALSRLRDSRSAALDAKTLVSAPIQLPAPRARFALDQILEIESGGKKERRVDGNEKSSIQGTPEIVPGKVGQALRFDDEYDTLALHEVGLFEMSEPFSASAWVQPGIAGRNQSLLCTAGDKNNFWRGWDFFLDAENRPSLKLIHSLPGNYIHVRTTASVATNAWTHLLFSYDGSGTAAGVRLFINGEPAATAALFDHLYKSIHPVKNDEQRTRENRPIRVARSYRAFTGDFGIFKGAIDDIQLFDTALTALEAARLYRTTLDLPLPPLDQFKLADLVDHHFVRADAEYRAQLDHLSSLRRRRLALADPLPEVMVMREMPAPRATHVLRRGQYDAPQGTVQPGTPESILPFPSDLPQNRLGLARWLFHADNPLTARVAVNRYWQVIFGAGLVKTTEDFGSQGAPPTHPELLDWLAVTFRESGWDVRELLRLMVTSHTYRQSSRITPEALEADPLNRWLARGPTYRLPAEIIRDCALAASGLLVPELGGPSAKPYQPAGLWIEKGNFSAKLLNYKTDQGAQLYRRSLYTFIRRTSPHPAMTLFDAPNRDVCTVRRERTSTPLQSLVLMNDPQFVEPARVLAARIQKETGPAVQDQIIRAFRLTTSRIPRERELDLLQHLFADQFAKFSENLDAARALLAIGAYRAPDELDPARTAALAVVANTLMNHTEFYMKR